MSTSQSFSRKGIWIIINARPLWLCLFFSIPYRSRSFRRFRLSIVFLINYGIHTMGCLLNRTDDSFLGSNKRMSPNVPWIIGHDENFIIRLNVCVFKDFWSIWWPEDDSRYDSHAAWIICTYFCWCALQQIKIPQVNRVKGLKIN